MAIEGLPESEHTFVLYDFFRSKISTSQRDLPFGVFRSRPETRVYQFLLIGSTLLGSWMGMQAVHELGHILSAWATGATVNRVVLHPLTISRTEVADNSRPLLVAWAGPAAGVTLPLVFWMIALSLRLQIAFIFQFFAGFCLIANGLYVSLGSINRVGDCDVILRNGSAEWQLWLFGVLTAPAGVGMWHGLGRHFGLGNGPQPISRGSACFAAALCAALFAVGLWFGR